MTPPTGSSPRARSQPINLNLIPNYADVFEGLKNQPHNTVDGVPYGVPHGRGANLLMYNTDAVTPAPGQLVDRLGSDSPWAEPVAGKVTAYGCPIYIADAAVYLMATQPELGITNPYALDEAQFEAAVDLLTQQRGMIGRYWTALHRPDRRLPGRRLRRGHDVAGHRQRARRPPTRPRRSRRSCPRRARPAGRTPGCCRRRRSTPTAATCS